MSKLRHLGGLLAVTVGSQAAAQAAFEAPDFRLPFKPGKAVVADGKFAFADALSEKLTRQGNPSLGVLSTSCSPAARSPLKKQSEDEGCQSVIGSNLTFGNYSPNFAPISVRVTIGTPKHTAKKD